MKKKRSIIKFSLATAGIFHLINKWIDSSSITKQSSSNSGTYYHWKHGDIYYKKKGHGVPLLLIHDLSPLSASFEWNELIDSLKDDYTLYIVDLPGCGKSDKPAITYTNYYFVQMITDFVHDVIEEPAHVAATGLSGSFVIMADAMQKDLFKTITLINLPELTQLKKQPDNHSKALQILFELPFVGTTAYYMITNRVNTEYFFTEKLMFNPFYVEPRLIKASYDASHAGNGFGKYLLGSIRGNYVNVDIAKSLGKTKTPVHLIYGAEYPHYHQAITEYRKINNNITAEIIDDCKMYPQIETIDDILESFFMYIN